MNPDRVKNDKLTLYELKCCEGLFSMFVESYINKLSMREYTIVIIL